MTEDIPLVLQGTYNPECSDFDEYLGCCKLSLLICRKEICPREVKA